MKILYFKLSAILCLILFTTEVFAQCKEQQQVLENLQEETRKRAEALDNAGARLEKEKTKVAIFNLFSCIDNELKIQKNQADKSFKESLAQINTAINEVKFNGLDPFKVKSEDGSVINLYQIKDEIEKSYNETMQNIESTINELNIQLENIMKELNS